VSQIANRIPPSCRPRSARSARSRSVSCCEYLADEFSLADIAHPGNFVRMRVLAEKCDIALAYYPNVAAWMQRIEAREGYKAAR
jgi:glutathione S-transferase